MELTLSGKVALVTGASRGIGEGIAKLFAEAGATVVITARKIEGLREAAARIEGDVHPFVAHAGDPAAAAGAVSEAIERFGRLDVLVNNAATNPHMGRMIDVDLARWDKTFEVNLRGPLIWVQEAWRQWMQHNGGSIVNVASIGGITAGGPIGVYDLTKSGLVFMTQHLATELGPKVRVNVIAPGLVKTDFARALWEGSEGRVWPWAMQRLGQPGDIAPAALFLASEAASWVTGALLVVDGGGSLTGSL